MPRERRRVKDKGRKILEGAQEREKKGEERGRRRGGGSEGARERGKCIHTFAEGEKRRKERGARQSRIVKLLECS